MIRAALSILLLALAGCGGGEQASAPPTVDQPPPAPDIRGEQVSYEAGGVTMSGYLAYDANRPGARPGVLIVHEWWGHNDYVRERARMLAEMGYVALALDMFGSGKQAAHPEDAQKFMMEVLNDMDAATARFAAAKSVLSAHASTDASRIAAIGYCFGGAIVLHMARFGTDLDGVASFHGSLGTASPAAAGAVRARMLVAHGADDPFVPAAEVEAFKAEMQNAGVNLKFVAYPGAVHGFTNPGATALGERFDMPLAYNAAADRQSWAELDAFLKQIFAD